VSVLASNDCYRPSGRAKRLLSGAVLGGLPIVFGLLRRWRPITGAWGMWAVTRHDDVLEAFAADEAFGVTYRDNIDVITGGQPFFLGLPDGPDYRAQLGAMRAVFLDDDLLRLGQAAEAHAAALVRASPGRIDVVDLVRRVTFGTFSDYLGIPEPANGRLDVWSSRLFEYQFTGSAKDKAWTAEVAEIASAFRAHIDTTIAARRAAGSGADDVLGRCLVRAVAGEPGYSDVQIRTALLCMILGGPPQPPMIVPQGIEQLLRRPAWLATAGEAARAGDDPRLRAILNEAMRFDPLAPSLPRKALCDYTLARGTRHEKTVPKGATLMVAFSSAMMDSRRVPVPTRFDPDRQPHEYIHFGHSMHECFGRMINAATLHRMVKPLLARPQVARARGSAGHLVKNGPFAERLELVFA
jgi:cytochrome P450